MKRYIGFFLMLLVFSSSLLLVGCGFTGSGGDGIHTDSYAPITGKFYLYEAADERIDCADTYFDIDGSEGNFSLKYYEKGVLKKEGVFQKIITREDRVGYYTDNLHLNLKCAGSYEHIGAYTESFDPINQFRIIDEYRSGSEDRNYLYSELPFVLGTYLREGATYAEETPDKNVPDHTVPTLANYTSELDGIYALDEEHYFYFISPKGYVLKNGDYMNSYFQYFSPELDRPIEGFAHGITYESSIAPPRLYLTYSRKASYYDMLEDTEKTLMFGYTTFTENDRMVEHYGSIDFSDGQLKSFSFEHLSRSWTEAEWDVYTKSEEATLPDAILYEYTGGTYTKK